MTILIEKSLTHAACNDYRDLAGNVGKEYINFDRGVILGLMVCDTHVGFKVVDGTFHNGTYFIKGIPFIRIPLEFGGHAGIYVLISVSGTFPFSTATRIFTATDPFALGHMDFWAYPFIPGRRRYGKA